MLKITGYVMLDGSVGGLCRRRGDDHHAGTRHSGHLRQVHRRVLSVPVRVVALWCWPASLFLGPRVVQLMALIREPFLLAFSTASSEAAYPRTVEQLRAVRVSRRISSASCCRWATRSISTAP